MTGITRTLTALALAITALTAANAAAHIVVAKAERDAGLTTSARTAQIGGGVSRLALPAAVTNWRMG